MSGVSLNEIFEDRNKLIGVLGVCALLIALDVVFLMKAQVNGIKQSGQKVVSLKKDLLKLDKDLAQMRRDAAGRKDVKVKKIISERELPSLLQYVSSVAAANAIKVMQIDSQKEMPRIATKGGKGGKSGGQPESVVTVVIRLDLESDYDTIAKFIAEIENSDQVLYIDEIKIARGVSDVMKQRVNLVLKTHVKK